MAVAAARLMVAGEDTAVVRATDHHGRSLLHWAAALGASVLWLA